MTKAYFNDRNHKPSPDEIRTVLAACFPLWERLTEFIGTHYQISGEWSSWGPKNFGCGFRYRKKGKALIALYPQKEQIMTQVVLGKTQAERALQLKLSEKVNRILREAPQLRDGRWLSIPVLDVTDADDVEQLLFVKMQPPQGVNHK